MITGWKASGLYVTWVSVWMVIPWRCSVCSIFKEKQAIRNAFNIDSYRLFYLLLFNFFVDGVNEVKALMQLTVRLITEEMLFNSITVRLDDMTEEAFLSPLLTFFIEGLAAIIPCPKENIFVFSIQVRSTLLSFVTLSDNNIQWLVYNCRVEHGCVFE